MSHQPRKRFGQNFLTDPGITDKICRAISPGPSDVLVEIGPGQAALTRPLLASGARVHAVELDRDLAAALEPLAAEYPRLTIHSGDALKFDFAALAPGPGQLRVVGNLPYNISTPLLFHLLEDVDRLRDMYFMLQKEVVDRLAAPPGNKQYGRLSVMVQYFCRVASLFEVPPECFQPRPKVDSAVVQLVPHTQRPWQAVDFSLFQTLVNRCFQQRRKTLRKSLQTLAPKSVVEELPVDVTLRPDQLSVESWVCLANALARTRQ